MKNKKAFTLIEILVVVLIIGILAAIALPQYRRATEKAIAMQGVIAAKAIGVAVQRYILINDSYPTKWEDLDISYNMGIHPNNPETSGILKHFNASFNSGDGNNQVLLDRLHIDSSNYRYTIAYCPSEGSIWCGAYVSSGKEGNKEKEKALCESLGGKEGYTMPSKCTTYRVYNYKL